MDMVTKLAELFPDHEVFPYGEEWPETYPEPDRSIACIRAKEGDQVFRIYFNEEDFPRYIVDMDYDGPQNIGPLHEFDTFEMAAHMVTFYVGWPKGKRTFYHYE